MNKELVDLQRNSKATCAVVKTEEYKQLTPIVSMNANVSDSFLLSSKLPPFAEKIDKKCAKNILCYFVIKEIDKVSKEAQNRFVGLIKDREFNGYILPDNCIIVLTVTNKTALTKLSPEINHFSVIAF